jgi:hypothetical protein
MVEPVSLNPPRRGLHQEFRIVIPFGEERIEGEADAGSFLSDLRIADGQGFVS